jgi:hypothetical protein
MSSELTLIKISDSSLSSFVFLIRRSPFAGHVVKLCILTEDVQPLEDYESYTKQTMRMEDLEKEARNQCTVYNEMLPLRVCPKLLLMGHIQRSACIPFLKNWRGNPETIRIAKYVLKCLHKHQSSLGYVVMEHISPSYGTLHFFVTDKSILDRSLRVVALLIYIFIKTKLCHADAHFENALVLKEWDDQVLDPIKIIDFGRVIHADRYTPIHIQGEMEDDYRMHYEAKTSMRFSEGLTHTYTVDGLTVDSLYTAIRHYAIIDYENTTNVAPKCIDLLAKVFPQLKRIYHLGQMVPPPMFSEEWFGKDVDCRENLDKILHLIQSQEQTRAVLQAQTREAHTLEVTEKPTKRAKDADQGLSSSNLKIRPPVTVSIHYAGSFVRSSHSRKHIKRKPRVTRKHPKKIKQL